MEKAAGDPAKLMTLADYAEKNGARKIAERACDTVARVRAETARRLADANFASRNPSARQKKFTPSLAGDAEDLA